MSLFLALRILAFVLLGLIASTVVIYSLMIATAARRDRRKAGLRAEVVAFVMGHGPLPRRQVYLPHALFEVARKLGPELRRILAEAALQRHVTTRARRRLILGSAGRRASSAEMLEVLGGPEDERALIRATRSRRSEVRIAAVRALGRLGLLIPALTLGLLPRAGKAEALSLVEAVEALGPPAVPACIEYLEVGGRWRPLVAEILGRIGGAEAQDALIAALEDPELDVVCRACNALQGFPDEAVEAALRTLLTHPAWEVRNQAVRTLGKVGGDGCLTDLSRALSDSAWWVRRNAADSLSSLEGGDALLVEALWSEDGFARDTAAHTLDTSGLIGDLASGTRHGAGARRADEILGRLVELDKGDLVRAPLLAPDRWSVA